MEFELIEHDPEYDFEVISYEEAGAAKAKFVESLLEVTPGFEEKDYYDLQTMLKNNHSLAYPSTWWMWVTKQKQTVSQYKRYVVSAHSAVYWTTTAYNVYSNREALLLLGKFAFQFLL